MVFGAGELRHKIKIQKITQPADEVHNRKERWGHVRFEMASIQPLRGEELVEANQVHSKATHKVTTHYFQGANSRMRIVVGERLFHVAAVINVNEQNRFLEWTCIEAE